MNHKELEMFQEIFYAENASSIGKVIQSTVDSRKTEILFVVFLLFFRVLEISVNLIDKTSAILKCVKEA